MKKLKPGSMTVHLILIILCTIFILPFIIVLGTSFVSEQEAARRGAFILIPQRFDITAYRILLGQGSIIYNAYKITLIRVIVGTALNLLFSSFMAYGLSKKFLPGRNTIITMIFITMLFSGGLVPNFLLVKGLGLYNSVWSMILPGLVNAWYMIIMKNFFTQLPDSLEESAVIDGATPFRILISIVFPISLPAFTTIGLFYAVAHWNSWFDASIYISDLKKLPVQIILRNVIISMSDKDINNRVVGKGMVKPPAETMKCAVIMVSTIPILCIYPFIQKYFVKGIVVGAIKG